jgi:cation transport regulator
MPYKDIRELPPALKKNLPKDAMQVYLTTYNHAWNRSMQAPRVGTPVEAIAHREAWSAVREKYRKQGQEWVRVYG